MTYALTDKHTHDYRAITPEKAKNLDSMLENIRKRLPTSEYIIGGGNSISLLMRIYQEILTKSIGYEAASKLIREWVPSEIKNIANGCYRDSNFVPHIICTEDNLESIVSEANKSNMKLMRRPKEITIWIGKKIEDYEPATLEEVKERSKTGRKDKFSSNTLRLVDLKNPKLPYFDLFVHHYISPTGEKVNLDRDMKFRTENTNMTIKPEDVRVVSNKDQEPEKKSEIIVSLEDFQPLPYLLNGYRFNVANPQYLFKVKQKHHLKRIKDTRDPIDLEVLHNILKFLQIDPMSNIRMNT